MAHQITIKEIVNGVEITETIDSNILISVLSYNAKPFFRSTNEEDVESFQIIDRIGEIYHLPALATEFTLIDINGNYFIPANGEELIEYSYKIRIFRPENEFDKVLNVGTVEATANTVKVNIPSVGLPNSVLINGSVYENYYPSLFNFVAVVEFTKILIVYAKPDSTVFYLAQGVEALSAVEPDYEGLFVARLIVNVSGIVIEEGGNNGDVLVKNGNSQEWSPRLTVAEQELVTIETRLDDLDDNDNSLQDQITAETTARQNADIAESNARTFADGVLDGKITTEKNRNDSQDSLISANASAIALKLEKPTADGTFSVKKVGAAITYEAASSSVINGFHSTSTTISGSAKNDYLLSNSIQNLNFGDTFIDVVVPHGTSESLNTVTSFVDDGENVSFSLNNASGHCGRLFNITENKFIISNIVGAEWITFGNRSGEYLAIYVNNDSYKGSIGRIKYDGSANIIGSVSINFNPDITKSFTFIYLSDSIQIYNDNVLWATVLKSIFGFLNKRMGMTQGGLSKSISYKYYVISEGYNPDAIPCLNVNIKTDSYGFPVIYKDNIFKRLAPFIGKKVTLYGDSITVAYDSANYASQILAKLDCSTVTRSGQSAQSFAGNLQNTTNVNALVATTPDLVVIHSVNDHRVNATIGTMADSAGTASTIGGLKTICNALINANKNVKIILCTPITYGAVAGGYPASNEPNASGKYMFEYAQAIMNFARSYGIAIADFSALCGFRPQVEGTSNRVFTSDGVHPNAVGYDPLTDIVADVANKM